MKKLMPVRLGLFSVLLTLFLLPSYAFAQGTDYRHAKAATASSGAATLNNLSGTITTESLTTAGLAAYTLTLTDKYVTTTAIVNVTVDNGTNSAGTPAVGTVTPGAGSVVIKIYNLHATVAFNGTLKIRFALAQ